MNGAAVGIGLVLSLFCDLRFATPTAKLSTGFTRRGFVAEHGSAWLLTRAIGPMNAADLVLSGRTITGTEAAALGLVRVLPAEHFLEDVLTYAPRAESVIH